MRILFALLRCTLLAALVLLVADVLHLFRATPEGEILFEPRIHAPSLKHYGARALGAVTGERPAAAAERVKEVAATCPSSSPSPLPR